MADNKFFNSKIYKIVCNVTGDIYIGSSCETLEERLKQHKHGYKSYMEGKFRFVTSFKILERDDYNIELICDYPCENNTELRKEEQRHIDMNECVNIQRAFSSKEYKRENKKEYRKKNKERDNRKFTCECGALSFYRCRKRHYSSKKHIQFKKENEKTNDNS
jgi:hypothetical protein